MRNLTGWTEECYDLRKDPGEKKNIVDDIDDKVKIELRRKLNYYLRSTVSEKKPFSSNEAEKINKRLRGLGYIE
jgi:hypothetical protein